jgi:hypothetical protein
MANLGLNVLQDLLLGQMEPCRTKHLQHSPGADLQEVLLVTATLIVDGLG